MAKSRKQTLRYAELLEERPKAVRVRLDGHPNPVWWPRHRIALDPEAMTITATEALVAEKLADADRDLAAERETKRAAERERTARPLAVRPDWENDRSVGVDGHFNDDHRFRVFLPKRALGGDGTLPYWKFLQFVGEAVERSAKLSNILVNSGGFFVFDGVRDGENSLMLSSGEIVGRVARGDGPIGGALDRRHGAD